MWERCLIPRVHSLLRMLLCIFGTGGRPGVQAQGARLEHLAEAALAEQALQQVALVQQLPARKAAALLVAQPPHLPAHRAAPQSQYSLRIMLTRWPARSCRQVSKPLGTAQVMHHANLSC